MLGIKKHVLELRNSLVILSRNFRRNFTQFSRYLGYFSHFWANFNTLGIKKHVLELKNSMLILAEDEGLQRGPKASKQPSARARLFGAPRQNVLVNKIVL